jgi:type I site-specific restriction-modification system R (restriction) subunit
MAESNKKETEEAEQKVALKASDESKETMKMEELENDEEEDESGKKKKKKTVKGELGGENPAEQACEANTAGNTISPNAGVPSTQQILANNSGIHVGREANSVSGYSQAPSDVSYGKSVNPDLLKESPLYVGLSKEFEALQSTISKKLDSVEKSFNDRIANMQKKLEIIESFGKQPFYKSINENVNPEAVMSESISTQIAKGKVRYSH